MNSVRIKMLLFASFRDLFGTKEFELDCDGTVKDLIDQASKKLGSRFRREIYDAHGGFKDGIIFAINGRNIKDLMGEPRLQNNDVVAVFPPVAGG